MTAGAVSWAGVPEGSHFPVQNLPFGRFRPAGSSEGFRIGVAIGDQLLDLKAAGLVDTDDMNVLLAQGAAERQALRTAISEGLREGSAKQAAWSRRSGRGIFDQLPTSAHVDRVTQRLRDAEAAEKR